MFTVVETSLFQKQWPLYWTEEKVVLLIMYVYAKAKTDNITGPKPPCP